MSSSSGSGQRSSPPEPVRGQNHLRMLRQAVQRARQGQRSPRALVSGQAQVLVGRGPPSQLVPPRLFRGRWPEEVRSRQPLQRRYGSCRRRGAFLQFHDACHHLAKIEPTTPAFSLARTTASQLFMVGSRPCSQPSVLRPDAGKEI